MLNMIKKHLKDEKGFTLIELIVVIAIIGILIAVAVPKLSGFTELARQSNDKQLSKMMANNVGILVASGKILPPPTGKTGTLTVINENGALKYTLAEATFYKSTGDITLNSEMAKLVDAGTKITSTSTTAKIVVTITPTSDISFEFID